MSTCGWISNMAECPLRLIWVRFAGTLCWGHNISKSTNKRSQQLHYTHADREKNINGKNKNTWRKTFLQLPKTEIKTIVYSLFSKRIYDSNTNHRY